MWLLLALSASALWGVHYALGGRLLRTLSPAELMVVLSACRLAIFGTLVIAGGNAGKLAPRELAPLAWPLAAIVATSAAANWMISTSIQGRNATIAGLIESTYPVFTALAAFIIFREAHLDARTALGGLFILAGVAIVAGGR